MPIKPINKGFCNYLNVTCVNNKGYLYTQCEAEMMKKPDEPMLAIYKNCIEHMTDTIKDWETVINFMCEQGKKHENRQSDYLDCIYALEYHFGRKDLSEKYNWDKDGDIWN